MPEFHYSNYTDIRPHCARWHKEELNSKYFAEYSETPPDVQKSLIDSHAVDGTKMIIDLLIHKRLKGRKSVSDFALFFIIIRYINDNTGIIPTFRNVFNIFQNNSIFAIIKQQNK